MSDERRALERPRTKCRVRSCPGAARPASGLCADCEAALADPTQDPGRYWEVRREDLGFLDGE